MRKINVVLDDKTAAGKDRSGKTWEEIIRLGVKAALDEKKKGGGNEAL